MSEKTIKILRQLRIFVSSTYRDLIEHRKAVLESIHSLGSFTSDMVYWAADERDPSTYSIDQLKNCDLIILILSHRYGTTLAGDKRSITEIEYDSALELKKPVITFFVDPRHEWPFIFVDRDNYDLLEKFKIKVQANHTVRQFTTPDHLARLVTEAVVQFVAGRTGLKLGKQFAPTVNLQEPVSHTNLIDLPDLSVVLGSSEDGLPLLLSVNRSGELEEFFREINFYKPDLSSAFPDEVIDTLRMSLDDRRRIHPVLMKDGNVETMYITRRTLSTIFRSVMSSLIGVGGKTRAVPAQFEAELALLNKRRSGKNRSVWSTDERLSDKSEISSSLESTGGNNRFLGISINTGKLHSVGREMGKWVEWHSFIPENLLLNLSDIEFKILTEDEVDDDERELTGSLEDLEPKLMNFAIRRLYQNGLFYDSVNFRVKRQSIAELCMKIVGCVEIYHNQHALVHGDLKPSNILLSSDGPVLIDGFNLREGSLSPGWTPFWSGPEQVTNEPVTFKSDVYSLGRLFVEVIGAYLIGEVKKIKFPMLSSGRDEFDVFYNPTVHLPLDSHNLSAEGFELWKTFLERTLQYHPSDRPNLEEFKQSLQELLAKAPLYGHVYFRIPGIICATEMPDGRQTLSRLVEDFFLIEEKPLMDDVHQTYGIKRIDNTTQNRKIEH